MAFTDPQSITINAVPYSCPRITDEATKSLYSTADANVQMTVSHSNGKGRIRHMARIDQRKIVADPLTAVNDYESLGIYIVVDRPEYGFSATEIDQAITGFKTWLSTATVTKIVGLEH